MSLDIILQIDDAKSFNAKSDSSLTLIKSALSGDKPIAKKLHYYLPHDLSLIDGELRMLAGECRLAGDDVTADNVVNDDVDGDVDDNVASDDIVGNDEIHDMDINVGGVIFSPRRQMVKAKDFDILLIRQNPPFNMSYISNLYLLAGSAAKDLFIVNNPLAILNNSEKLSALSFPQYIPPTIVTSSIKEIKSFLDDHGKIVVKPLYGFGGDGIFSIAKDDNNYKPLIDILKSHPLSDASPLVIQKFLPEVTDEESRILVIGGEASACFGRRPSKGDFRANMRIDGEPIKREMSDKQKEISSNVGKYLLQEGIFLAGLDFIGDYLIEINITSPTGLKTADDLYKINTGAIFWRSVLLQMK